MFQNVRKKRKPYFMIIPMIDIIFFLLVFFMMNSLQTVAQKALAVQLPQAKHAAAPAQLPIVLTLDKDGHITVDNRPVSYDEAAAVMQQHMAENPDAAVVLQADEKTAHGQVVAIMDMLKGAGVHRLAIAAKQRN
ncbi:MAG: biopolymer transporter ExbD [Selenomonadaceae bacterium]|nr:biopolymer transporter ExbD [Selenomonadaceae bacterium]